MPKLRMTERQRREKSLELAMARARVELGIPNRACCLAEHLGMSPSQYSKRCQRGLYRSFGFEEAAELAQRLHFTGQELCAICGIPYVAEGTEKKGERT